MAFTTSNVNGGPLGNRFKLEGDWTGSIGDAAGTVTVSGGRVYEAVFSQQTTTGPTTSIPYSVSASGSQLTISVYNHEDVTAGRFSIIYG